MLDFLHISTKLTKQGTQIYPTFIINPSSTDLMIRGGDFYAVWNEDSKKWSTDEYTVIQLVDRELDIFAEKNKEKFVNASISYMWDADSMMIDKWHKYCQKQCRDHYKPLDETLIFANTDTKKEHYSTKRLSYPLIEGEHTNYDALMDVLYSAEERQKIEWAIGAIVNGDSKSIQKFLVLYGSGGTGKSTVLNIIQMLFDGYYSVFDAKSLGSASNAFALEAFKTNPLVAIQHDGDLSHIEDNTRLNSLVSHEYMTVNEKFKSTYTSKFNSFMFMGTNKPVKITDGKSGLIRRLIDVSPTGKKIPFNLYSQYMNGIKFELGAIAYHCKQVYENNKDIYDTYIPRNMMGASNDFYNYVMDSYHVFVTNNGTSLKAAWERYVNYCEDTKVPYPLSQRLFKEELKNYFWDFKERFVTEDGNRLRSYYSGFRTDIFESDMEPEEKEIVTTNALDNWLVLDKEYSLLDDVCAGCYAQGTTSTGNPKAKWDDVTTYLRDLDTKLLHFLLLPIHHIVVDFDIKDENGEKSLKLNLDAASKFPPTYAEVSKSGQGLHLHYYYMGDPDELSRLYAEDIEIKIFKGNSSLRRKLTKCNDIPIATINSGLPLRKKGANNVLDNNVHITEKGLRTTIHKCLDKQIHSSTRCNMDFIAKILDDAYNSGIHYDVSDLKNDIIIFASNSTHQSDYCLKLIKKIHFKSEEASESIDIIDDAPIVFYDVEVFKNLFVVCWKYQDNPTVVAMINPTPQDVEPLFKTRLIGFNNRQYDNHILYARLLGYTNAELYDLSQAIISSSKGNRYNFFREAFNISYTDIYDFASAGNKKSLKKLEIEMGIHHQELGIPWDAEVPEERFNEVANYCKNDVIATEAAFNYLKADWTARLILSDLAGMTANDTTNSLTTRIIFGNNKHPQGEFFYRNLAEPVKELPSDVYKFLKNACPSMMSTLHGTAKSLLPYFPGYKYEYGVSTYKGMETGEGGEVYAEPGMYINVALLDIASMHPHSTISECLFGPRFTTAFRDIVEGRVSIKHEAWDDVNQMLDGKLAPYIQKVLNGELTSDELADGLKTAINAVYGLTAASFENPFKDKRNIDNIVAKRGALFMIDLKEAVEAKGYTVAHIKTDSIKIPNSDPEIIKFVMDFGERYGYTFEHEATYEKMCLVNNAVYIARYATAEWCDDAYGYIPKKNKKKSHGWDATGTQFQIPYVFKSLFSKEPLIFEDFCETKSVTSALYLDMNESNEEEHDYQFIGRVGQFCPIKPGCGGGLLRRQAVDKNGEIVYNAATGSKTYRWLESETVRLLNKQDDIDIRYYQELADKAIDEISKYGDYYWFVSDDPVVEDLPWIRPCGRLSCNGCKDFNSEDIVCNNHYDINDLVINNDDNFNKR